MRLGKRQQSGKLAKILKNNENIQALRKRTINKQLLSILTFTAYLPGVPL